MTDQNDSNQNSLKDNNPECVVTNEGVEPAFTTLELDRFLLSALTTPRDRLFILKLDQDLEKFIKDPRRFRLEFPAMSSYQRLIIHRVAQYFKLEHPVLDFDGQKRAVVLQKTSESRVPILRFYDLVEHQEQPEGQAKAVKIMRRGSTPPAQQQLNKSQEVLPTPSPKIMTKARSASSADTHASPATIATVASHSNSSNSSDSPKDKTLEEREKEYATARARIFGAMEANNNSEIENNEENITPKTEDAKVANIAEKTTPASPSTITTTTTTTTTTSPVVNPIQIAQPTKPPTNTNPNKQPSHRKPVADNEFMDFYRGTDIDANWVVWNRTHQPPVNYYPPFDPSLAAPPEQYLPRTAPAPGPSGMVAWPAGYPPMYPMYPPMMPGFPAGNQPPTSPPGGYAPSQVQQRPQPNKNQQNKQRQNSGNVTMIAPPPQFYQQRPMPVYRYPNNPHDDTMWSFYATPYTSPIVGPPTIPVTGYYPYSDRRPPPKSTELFDPNKSNSINSNTSPQNKNNNNNMYKYNNNNINGNIMNGTVTINGMVVEDRGLHANFKRSPSHDSFFNSTTKQDDESSNSADGTDKPPTLVHLDHILEVTGKLNESSLNEIRQSGGTIKVLDGTTVAIYKNSAMARQALAKLSTSLESNVHMSIWKLPLSSGPQVPSTAESSERASVSGPPSPTLPRNFDEKLSFKDM